MHRRNLLKGAGVIALYSSFPVVVSEFLTSCSAPDKLKPLFFSPAEFNIVEDIVTILLPRTATPGGLDTKTPFFIDKVVQDCFLPENQQQIRKGIAALDKVNSKQFALLSNDEKKQLISNTDKDAFSENTNSAWFRIVKKLALIGHFTSQEGMTTALNYVKVPGDYKASIPYKKGDKAMAKTFLMYW